ASGAWLEVRIVVPRPPPAPQRRPTAGIDEPRPLPDSAGSQLLNALSLSDGVTEQITRQLPALRQLHHLHRITEVKVKKFILAKTVQCREFGWRNEIINGGTEKPLAGNPTHAARRLVGTSKITAFLG